MAPELPKMAQNFSVKSPNGEKKKLWQPSARNKTWSRFKCVTMQKRQFSAIGRTKKPPPGSKNGQIGLKWVPNIILCHKITKKDPTTTGRHFGVLCGCLVQDSTLEPTAISSCHKVCTTVFRRNHRLTGYVNSMKIVPVLLWLRLGWVSHMVWYIRKSRIKWDLKGWFRMLKSTWKRRKIIKCWISMK